MTDIAAANREVAPPSIGFFEKYLTVWVALCIVVGIALGHLLPGLFGVIAQAEIARVNIPVAVLIWLMIVPMLLRVDFASLAKVGHLLARHRRHALHQLGGQAVLDGAARLAVHRLAVPAAAAGDADRFLHRRPDHPGGRALHGDGLRLVEPDTRRAEFHPVAGGAERRDHDRRLRADRRPAARPFRDHGAVGHADAVGRALHRHPGHRGAGAAPQAAGDRRPGRARSADFHDPADLAHRRCWRRWCCSSASRASRSSHSRWSSRCWPCRS